ncbi:hypothetical protein FHX42_005182 [Saccharopolyspora lacisalsi]|uniref:DDE Tnp4 domain-containing protein n=1 Tax=Halosaccharopolyspora lacisalsi TaxID=1000566 RepID=A0A839E790_9PSEU|nr:hypothetical protein [Halosaccharopolyspora lacisalsi]
MSEKTTSAHGYTIDLWYSGKAGEHGENIQALSAPTGTPLWTSDVEPGSTHDMSCARQHVLGACYATASQGLPTLADSGYERAGIGVHTPVKQPAGTQRLDPDNRTYNALLRSLRGLGERGFALLTQRWQTLQHLTASPAKSATSSQPLSP